MSDMVPIPFGNGYLQMTETEFATVLARGLAPGPSSASEPKGVATLGERWLTSHEIAELTGIPATWWEARAKAGDVPHTRAGKYVRFRLSECERALRDNQRPAGREPAGRR